MTWTFLCSLTAANDRPTLVASSNDGNAASDPCREFFVEEVVDLEIGDRL